MTWVVWDGGMREGDFMMNLTPAEAALCAKFAKHIGKTTTYNIAVVLEKA